MTYKGKTPIEDTQKRVDLMFRPEKADAPDTKPSNKKKLWFKGIASTDSIDQQGERVLMDGLDLGYFVSHGWFDDGHSKSAKDGLGRPSLAKVVDLDKGRKGVYVEGYLYDTPSNRQLYDLMIAVGEAEDTGAIGLSLYGPVKERSMDGKTLKKAVVRNCAITRNPVNPETYIEVMQKSLDEMVKALDGGMTAGYPAPAYADGGTAAPLFKQDILTVQTGASVSPALGGKKKMKVNKADWEALTDDARKAFEDVATAQGVEVSVFEEVASVMEKALGDCDDNMIKALADVKATWDANGVVATFDPDNINEIGTTIGAHTEAMNSVRDVMSKSMDVLVTHNAAIAAMETRFAAIETAFADTMNKVMDAVRQPTMAKAFTEVAPDSIVAKPGENMGGDMLSREEAKSMLKKSFDAATDENQKRQFKAMYEKVSLSGFKGTKEQLQTVISTVAE